MKYLPEQSSDFVLGISPQDFIGFLVLFFLQLAILALVITLTVLNRRFFKQYFKTGLVIALVTFTLSLPLQITALFAMDPAGIAGMYDGGAFGSQFGQMMYGIMMAAQVITLLVGIGWTMLTYVIAASEWRRFTSFPFPVLMGAARKGWGKIGIAAGVGAVAAVVSVIVARLMNVGPNQLMERQLQAFMNIDALPGALQFLFMLLFVVQAAITEEVLYRGALLGFLSRVSKNRTALLLGSIFLVSLVWALMHLFNSDSPVFKISQVFILGTIFAEFARRWSLESAIAAHATLNIVAGTLEFLHLF